jgi:threonine/homoserine/homoserine lactone efflux protein
MLHPVLDALKWPVAMGMGMVLSFAFTGLAIGFGETLKAASWLVYSIPIVAFALLAWGVQKWRRWKDQRVEYDSKNFTGSQKALDWWVEGLKKREEEAQS